MALAQAWPESELVVDEGEGHGGLSMVEEWAAANSRLADRLRPRVDRAALPTAVTELGHDIAR